MASKSTLGNYAAKISLSITESAANTLTFEKIETGMSVYDKVGWVLGRVEIDYSGALSLFNGTGDQLYVGLVQTNTLTSSQVTSDNPAIYFLDILRRTDLGTAANGWISPSKLVNDYSHLPGGGLLLLPNPLYGAVVGSGLSGASSVTISLFVTPVDLTPDDYANLLTARQLQISS